MLTPPDLSPRSVQYQQIIFQLLFFRDKMLLDFFDKNFVHLCFISEKGFPEIIGSSSFS